MSLFIAQRGPRIASISTVGQRDSLRVARTVADRCGDLVAHHALGRPLEHDGELTAHLPEHPNPVDRVLPERQHVLLAIALGELLGSLGGRRRSRA